MMRFLRLLQIITGVVIDMMPSERALLTEYQVCQNSRNEQTSAFWAFAGIVLGFSITGFGFIVPNIFKIHSNNFKILTYVISGGVILIYICLCKVLAHINAVNELYQNRMIEIEELTGMNAKREQKSS